MSYYEQSYINKLNNSEKMNKFLETYNLLKPNQDEKRPGPNDIIAEFY